MTLVIAGSDILLWGIGKALALTMHLESGF
ncbi:hypothetical protein BOS5A_210989 [Bosea sp. EC-HK365B]|nr:hypothetical protein BOSE7B_120849 [Bosea sp. 7B]VVT60198.1 hypothetical protein BOS5A_210989 [Bosea sp. EC-HK365B]VXC21124.1 hypothetical protein BOSE127_170487 [Bosea sp. 127]